MYFPGLGRPDDVLPTPLRDAAKAVSGSATILVCDDEPKVLRRTGLMLERLGFDVILASTPEQSLKQDMSSLHSVEMLVADVVMPGTNGRGLVAKLREYVADLKVLCVFGYSSRVPDKEGELNEATEFLDKSYGAEQLAQRVSAIPQRPMVRK